MQATGNLTGTADAAPRPGLKRAALALLAATVLAQGCGDDAGGGATTSTTSSSTSSSSTSTSSGSGGGGSGGSGGSGGGSGIACIDAESYSALFSVNDAALCAVAVYTTDLQLGAGATWGRHGGPLLVQRSAQPQGSIDLVRLTPPSGPTGAFTKALTAIAAGIPEDAFLGAQAVDLPFFGWTAISWTSPFPSTQGEVILADANGVATRYDVNGYFATAAIEGRLLHSGMSQVGEPAAVANGLYAADSCGAAGQDPRLLPEGDASCADPTAVATWGDYSGPVAADRSGNVFAVLVRATGEQEARGFAAPTVARGAGPAEGDVLLTVPGGGVSLAALAPEGDAPGLLVFQPTDASYVALDPIAMAYHATNAAVDVEGPPTPLLSLATADTSLALIADADNRLWVGAPSPGPGGGTTFVVIARR